MSRQIKSDLFNENNGSSFSVPVVPTPAKIEADFESHEPSLHYDDLLARIEKVQFQMSEWTKLTNLKFEKVGQRFQTMEERLKAAVMENHERLGGVASRIKDRSTSDVKIEALFERHNQIVQSFELRLSQAQRLIENQALQLAKQQELIDDARRQIEKLKKL